MFCCPREKSDMAFFGHSGESRNPAFSLLQTHWTLVPAPDPESKPVPDINPGSGTSCGPGFTGLTTFYETVTFQYHQSSGFERVLSMNSSSSLFSNASPSSFRITLLRSFAIIGVILLGFFLRLFACLHTSIVNPDGTLYIHQARAIYYGVWDQLTSCSINYVSAYPLLITGAYTLFHDWVTAARFVSLLFGSLAIVPAYLILRRFYQFPVNVGGTLVFAVMPLFVGESADVIKEPFAWFFALLGLFLFIRHLESKKGIPAVLSSLSYLVASWARPEVFLFFSVSGLYLFFVERGKKPWRLFCYFSPVVAVILAGLIGAKFLGISLTHLYRIQEMLSKISEPLTVYRSLRTALQSLISRTEIDYLKLFLQQTRHLIWVVALATVVSYLVEAFFYPFFLVFLIGLKGLGARLRSDTRTLYLALVTSSAFLLLYLHTLQSWFGTNRFMYLVILPSLVFISAGLEKTIHFLTRRFKFSPGIAVSVVFSFILLFGLPNDLKPRETDKLVFKEMGEFIAKTDNSSKPVRIATSLNILRWVSFYANLHVAGAPCPQPYSDYEEITGKDYDEFVRNLKARGITYFIWEEKHWPPNAFDFMKKMNPKQFQLLLTKYHRDTGKILLFRFYAPP
jgi:hypothetical protein